MLTLIFRQLQTLESRINSDMRSILELLQEVAGPGVGLRDQAEPESARVQLSGARPQHTEASSDQVRGDQ